MSTILDHLYDTFGPADQGEDYAFGIPEGEREIALARAEYWAEVNAVRADAGVLRWDDVVTEGYNKVRAERDPNLLTDRLLELGAAVVAFAESVQRQTNAINALGEALAEEEE